MTDATQSPILKLKAIDLSNPSGLQRIRTAALEAEKLECKALWAGETLHDPFIESTLALDATSSLQVATGIVIGFARSPMTIAHQAVDLQDLSDGRFILGIGSQVRAHITKRFSMPWGRPVPQMGEMLDSIRAVWDHWYDDAPLDFRGEYYQLTFNSAAFRRRPSHPDRPPIYLAAVGPKMLALAAEKADGFISHGFVTERYLRSNVIPVLDRGERGRLASFDRVVTCFAAVDNGTEEARADKERARAAVALYGSTPAYRPVLDVHGLGDLHEELYRLSRQDRWNEMARLIDDEVLALFLTWGSVEHVVETLLARFGDIASRLRLPFHARGLVPALQARVRMTGRSSSRPAQSADELGSLGA